MQKWQQLWPSLDVGAAGECYLFMMYNYCQGENLMVKMAPLLLLRLLILLHRPAADFAT
jgi:hypothetical protein